jgi:hypothetical protein
MSHDIAARCGVERGRAGSVIVEEDPTEPIEPASPDSLALPHVEETTSAAMPDLDAASGAPRGGSTAVPWLLVAVLACVAIALAVALVVAMKTTPSMDQLRSQRDEAREQLAKTERELDDARQQLRQAAAVDGATETASSDAEEEDDSSGVTEVAKGAVGKDGDLAFRVLDVRPIRSFSTYFDTYRPKSGAVFFQVQAQVANNGTAAADPFCGGNGVLLVDVKDREYEPQRDAIGIDGNVTCGDGIRPGFRNTEKLVFELPAGSVPAAVELWNRDDGKDYFGEATRVRANLR